MTTVADFLPASDIRLGSIDIVKVFDYYDAPLLFSARNDRGNLYVAYAADYAAGSTTFLYAGVSETRLRQLEGGRLPLRTAYLDPLHGSVFAVTVRDTLDDVPTEVTELAVPEIPARWLPDVGIRITSPPEPSGPDLEAFDANELLVTAQREGRHLVALEFASPETEGRMEARLRDAGPIMVEFQAMADTLSTHSDFALQSLQAASIVLVLSPATGDGMFGQAAPELLSDLERLFQAVGDGPDFSRYLAGVDRRVRAHIRDFLSVPSDASADLSLFIAPPAGPLVQQELPLARIRAGLRTIRDSKVLPDSVESFDGYLEGINHARRTFSVRRLPTGSEKKGRAYSGRFDPDVDIEGLSSGLTILYRFSLVREAEESEFGEITYRNRITALERLDDQ